MRLRTVLNLLIALAALGSAASAAAQSATQEHPARRLANVAGVAVEEYGKGVDSAGRIFAQLEYDEAATFLTDARSLADRVPDARAAELGAIIDEMRRAVAAKRPPAELGAIHARLVALLGPDGALEFPAAPVDLARGASIYAARCASCHGETGAGDGPASKGMNPRPPAFADRALMGDVTPALMYRIVSVGIQGTAMAGFADLSSADRWAVVTYANTLRADAQEAARGLALLERRCSRCTDGVPTGHSFAWLAERHDGQVLSALTTGDAQLGMESQPPLSERDARAILAGLRSRPLVIAAAERTPAAIAADVVRILDEAIERARRGDAQHAGDLAFDAYVAFEPLESNVRTRNPGLIAALERHFADLKGSVQANDIVAAGSARARIVAGLPEVVDLADAPSTGVGAFFESLLIIVREGFEAILVLGAVIAFLVKTGNASRVKEIWVGAGAGLAASAVLAIALRTALANAPASRELIEGATMLLAVVVLFSVSYWLLSKVEAARWQRFIREKVGAAVTSGRAHALALVAFLAVFREGAETALFYQALLMRGAHVVSPVLSGLGVGALALVAIWVAFHRFGMRLPLRTFFATTSALLYYLAFVFAGKGLRELQEGNVLSITPLERGPYIEFLGVFPSVETLAAQGVLVMLALFALWRTLWVREGVSTPARAAGSVVHATQRIGAEPDGG